MENKQVGRNDLAEVQSLDPCSVCPRSCTNWKFGHTMEGFCHRLPTLMSFFTGPLSVLLSNQFQPLHTLTHSTIFSEAFAISPLWAHSEGGRATALLQLIF